MRPRGRWQPQRNVVFSFSILALPKSLAKFLQASLKICRVNYAAVWQAKQKGWCGVNTEALRSINTFVHSFNRLCVCVIRPKLRDSELPVVSPDCVVVD